MAVSHVGSVRDHRQGGQADEQCGRVDARTTGIAGRQRHERKHDATKPRTKPTEVQPRTATEWKQGGSRLRCLREGCY
eukprot:scaffold72530_cov64-Phaeocystis_antarctica.AAC.9